MRNAQEGSVAQVTQLIAVKANARGLPTGESNPQARHPDKLVEQARQMHRAQGMKPRQIAELLGVNATTMRHWLNLRRRGTPWARIRMKRVTT